MTIRHLISVLAAVQSPPLTGTLLSAPDVHPLNQPVLFLRETIPADAPFLLAAAASGNFRTLNFPSTREGLERKIRLSQTSFRGAVTDPDDQEFMFTVLAPEENGEQIPVGTSTFYPRHGTSSKPHHAYQVVRSSRNQDGIVIDETSLILTQNHDGPAEVGALVVHDAVRGNHRMRKRVEILVEGVTHTLNLRGSCGTAASWVRFFWAGMPHLRSPYYNRACLTEILPPLVDLPDGGRTNAFYESLARRYLDGRPYDEMDLVTHEDRSLIAARLPKVVQISELPADAAALMGQARPESVPAMKLLRKLGFRPTDRIDPLDGGPHLEGFFLENPIFVGVRDFDFGGTTGYERGELGWSYGFLGSIAEGGDVVFRAALGPFFTVDRDLFTTRNVAKALQTRIGERVTVSPL